MSDPPPSLIPPRQPPRLGSLRARLIASHVAVLLLALLLVLVVSAPFLRRYEEDAELERLAGIAVPLTVEANLLLRGDRPPIERPVVTNVLDAQAAEMDVRLLVFDPGGTVLYDSAATGSLAGQTLDAYARSIGQVYAAAQQGRRIRQDVARPAADAGADPLAGNRLVVAARGPSARAVLGLAAPAPDRPLVGRFVRPLLLALLIALAVAALAGYLLSRRIAAPVGRLTRAADAMAAGALEQRVPGEGPDEIGRLVASFNAMSHRVATTARGQRDFLANVAHELRTPLTSLRGYARALRDGVASEPADRERALATITAESERMAALVQQLLDLARLESGQTRLNLQPVPADAALADLARRFAPDAAQKQITLATDAPPDLRLHVDPERLAQILANLTANALRHTPAGGRIAITATATPHRLADGSPAVRLLIADTGEGIPPDRLATLFDRFTRGDGTAPGTGVGLGLAIARDLVHAHRGTIAVQSQPGGGTTFTVDFPASP